MFEIGKWVKILGGEYTDWYLMIGDDTNGSTGGFYIHTVKNSNEESSEGYDDWVENENELRKYMSHLKIQINWNV